MKQFFYFVPKSIPMKKIVSYFLLLCVISLFVKAGCSKDDEIEDLPAPTADEYITWNFGANQGLLTEPSNTVSASSMFGNTFVGGGNGSGSTCGLYFTGTGTGTFPAQIQLQIGSKEYGSNAPTNVTVTQFGTVGGYIQGSYSGRLKDTVTAEIFDVRGLFRAKLQ